MFAPTTETAAEQPTERSITHTNNKTIILFITVRLSRFSHNFLKRMPHNRRRTLQFDILGNRWCTSSHTAAYFCKCAVYVIKAMHLHYFLWCYPLCHYFFTSAAAGCSAALDSTLSTTTFGATRFVFALLWVIRRLSVSAIAISKDFFILSMAFTGAAPYFSTSHFLL